MATLGRLSGRVSEGHDANRPAIAGKPDLAAGGQAAGRRHSAIDLRGLHAVGQAVECDRRMKAGMIGEWVQVAAARPPEMAFGPLIQKVPCASSRI